MYKIIFIDIDGTLRNSSENVSNETIAAIKKVTDKGILVILCSGRPRKYTEEISKQCFASKYIITSGGGNVFDYEENKTLYTNEMNKEAIIELYEIARSADVRFMMNVGECRVVNRVKHPEQEIQLVEDIKDFVCKNKVLQCTIADSDFSKIKELVPKIEAVKNVEIKNRHQALFDYKYIDSRTIYCDVANIDSDKGVAIRKLLEILNIKKENAVGIGDGVNDIPMFREVGYKVAVSNAMDVLKDAADEITLSNNEDGVAAFLNKLLI